MQSPIKQIGNDSFVFYTDKKKKSDKILNQLVLKDNKVSQIEYENEKSVNLEIEKAKGFGGVRRP